MMLDSLGWIITTVFLVALLIIVGTPHPCTAAISRAAASADLTDSLMGTGLGRQGAEQICSKLTVAQMQVLTYRVNILLDRSAALEQDGRTRVVHTVANLDSTVTHDVFVDGIRMVRFPGGSVISFWTVPGREVIIR
jgi:hypothetical protein